MKKNKIMNLPSRVFSVKIDIIHWTVQTIRKHIKSQHSLAGGGVGVGVQESAGGGVIIAGLEVIKASFAVVVVATVAQGVSLGHGTGGGEDVAVGVVGIAGNGVSAGIDQPHYIALEVGDVIVVGAVALHGVGHSVSVVEEVQGGVGAGMVLPQQLTAGIAVVDGCAVYDLIIPESVAVVDIGIGLAVYYRFGQSSALAPGKGVPPAIVVAQRIAAAVVGNGLSVIGGQQVSPLAVAIGIAVAGCAVALGKDVAPQVVGIGVGLLQANRFEISARIPHPSASLTPSPVAVPGECPRRRRAFVPRRPLPLAQVASSAAGSAPIAPPGGRLGGFHRGTELRGLYNIPCPRRG